MPWTIKEKRISTTRATAHSATRAGIAGRAPGVTTIKFTPAELYGATARCSHISAVNPEIVTPESQIIEALIREYVNETDSDFAILSTADKFKDFVKSYFVGTVASGISYLQMIRDGYSWKDHFDIKAATASTGKSPDFVFEREDGSVALVESKGTRSDSTVSAFDSTVAQGYIQQIEPHLATYSGTRANHGFCIGSWLTSETKAELLIHYTEPSGGEVALQPRNASGLSAVQIGDYAEAFRLAHSDELGNRFREGSLDVIVGFIELDWLGRKFLAIPRSQQVLFHIAKGGAPTFAVADRIFAIERDVASRVLAMRSGIGSDGELLERLQPMPRALADQAREMGGALFPDGLAVVSAGERIGGARVVVWGGKYFADGPEMKQVETIRDLQRALICDLVCAPTSASLRRLLSL